MRRHLFIKVAVAAALALGSAQLLSVADASGRTPGAPAAKAEKKKGNGFGRALSAPFRAIGRLFGGGGKGEKKSAATAEKREAPKAEGREAEKPRRLTEKDAAEFQGATTMRVSYGSTEPAPAAPAAAPGELVAEARSLLARAQFNEAISLLSTAASTAPNLAEAHHLLGYAYDRKGQRQLSLNSYARALKLAPNDPQLLNDYGYSLHLRGHHDRAKDLLKRAAKLSPGDERVWNNLAVVQIKLEKYDDAFKSFARAGGEFKGRLNVAGFLERAGRFDAALKHYEAARQLNPTSRAVLQHLADLYQRLGRAEEAAAARAALAVPEPEKAKASNGGQ